MQYLEVPYQEKDQAKALGARWDAARKKWFVPTELSGDLTPFQRWLPTQTDQLPEIQEQADAPLSLSQLLLQVEAVVQRRFPTSLWVRAEIAELSERRHLYLHLVETSEAGEELAKVRAMLWQDQIDAVMGKFRQETGGFLQAGQKVLLKVQVRFHRNYGLTLHIEDIDPSYTLGDIQAQLTKLRQQLKALGLYDRNRRLPKPVEFTRVAVIAPPKAAGLGDFQQDARLLEAHELCHFTYFHASFQGEAVESEFMAAFDAVEAMHARTPFDALAIIRGGGAQLDLHQLNRLSIAQRIAQCPMPVFTGIGHERDNTLLDEVAAQRFDTPSKVVAHIHAVIVQNAQRAQQDWLWIQKQARQQLHTAQLGINKLNQHVYQQARAQLQHARHQLTYLRQQLQWRARQTIDRQKQRLGQMAQHVHHQARAPLPLQRQKLDQLRTQIRDQARRIPAHARQQVDNWMRQILLLGPKMQLQRGFALIRDEQGRVVRHARDLQIDQTIQIQFDDGFRTARVES